MPSSSSTRARCSAIRALRRCSPIIAPSPKARRARRLHSAAAARRRAPRSLRRRATKIERQKSPICSRKVSFCMRKSEQNRSYSTACNCRLASRMTRIETMKAAATTSAAQIRQMLEELQAEDATITRRLAAIKECVCILNAFSIVDSHLSRHCARYTKELLACGVDRAFIERTHAYIQRATRAESDALLQSLLRVTLVTSPFDWLTTKSNKAYAESIVRACVRLLKARRVERTDGVFLIRPSATRANCYALVISAGDGDEIYNCLIEYCEPPPQQSANAAAAAASTSAAGVACESFGYAFANTQLFYATLCDFVRYYSLVTLREHNEQLDTVLRIPALRFAHALFAAAAAKKNARF